MKLSRFVLPREWDKALAPIEQFTRQVTDILTQGLSVADQTSWLRTVRYVEGTPLSVSVEMRSAPLLVAVARVQETFAPGAFVSGAAVTWEWTATSSGSSVTITGVAGLTSGTDYTVQLLIVER